MTQGAAMTSRSPAEKLQRTVGVFQEQQSTEIGRNALIKAGFSAEQVFIQTQTLDPNPPIRDTKALESAGGGALIGMFLGALIGLLLSLNAGSMPDVSPIAFVNSGAFSWGTIFAASGVGAVAGGLMAALAGVNVPKPETRVDRDRLSHKYLLLLVGSEAEAAQAEELIRQFS
jgi:hypothetical protein